MTVIVGLPLAPFPLTYRELWLPGAIKDDTGPTPPSIEGGHELTFTVLGRKGTTVDGVRGNGAITSNINCGANAVDNAAAKYWVSLRFRRDTDWTSGDGDQYLWGKFVDATHYIRLKLDSATGNLIFEKDEGGAGFTLSIASPSGDGTWHAGVWYHALCSIANPAGARFKVNDASLQTDADVNPMPNGGFLCFLDYDDPGAGTGFEGVEVDMFCGTDDLTAVEETDMFKGFPPNDAVHIYSLDEGRGVTTTDRGSGLDNGTLDTSCTWAWGQVQQPVFSFKGFGDVAQTAAGVCDMGGDFTVVWVGKMKSTYTDLAGHHYILVLQVDGNNELFWYYHFTSDTIIFYAQGAGGVNSIIYYADRPAIDDYWILITTFYAGRLTLFRNGSLAGRATALTGLLPVGGARFTLSWSNDISKVLFATVIDGAFNEKQARVYSEYLRDIFNLPITI